jgi:hypothetical protein
VTTSRAWLRPRVFTPGRADDLAPGIYGTVICASVLVALDERKPIWTAVLTVVVTVLVYWLAERYSVLLAAHMRQERTVDQVRAILRHGWMMVQASYTPVLVLIAAWFLGASTRTAIAAALYYTTGLLLVLGWMVGRRGGQTGLALAGTVSFVGGLGVVIVMLKFLLH